MKEILKKNQAITLVSLVVTIIILIILAGVSINLILGKNGIITMAKQAKENIELAKIEEETALNELYMQIEAEGGTAGDISYDAIAKLVEFKREIASAISDMGVTTLEDADATTMASNIRSISGASSADKVSYYNTNSGLAATNVQGAIDEVNDSLQNINVGAWTKLSSVTGTTSINISSISFNELHIRINYNVNSYTIHILKEYLTDSLQYFYTGYYINATGYGRGVIAATKSEIKLYSGIFDTSEKTSVATLEVYYR